MRRDKEALRTAVEKLQVAVAKFAERIKGSIQNRIDKNIEELLRSFLPALAKRPPTEWVPSSGERPDKETIRARLKHDLRAAFGTAEQLTRDMKVRCMFKGVTYELLNDSEFIKAATQAIPELEGFHLEFDAAEAARQPSHPRGSAQHLLFSDPE